MTSSPVVSVLLTSFNHGGYVEQALESVAAQSFQDLELIITDDCSTDRSADVIRAWLDRTGYSAKFIINERNLGICAVRNNALRHAHGRFVCSLSGDDWYEPDRLHRQVTFFSVQPDSVGLIYSDIRPCLPDGSELNPSFLSRIFETPPEGHIFDRLLGGNFLPAPGVMIRRSAIDTVGPYDERLVFEDYDMWLRLANRFEVRHLAGVVSNRRELPTSMSNSPDWRPRMDTSSMQILVKWVGHSHATDAAIARRVRSRAVILAQVNRVLARELLKATSSVPPRIRWRLAAAAITVPGGELPFVAWAKVRQRRRRRLRAQGN